MNKSSMHVEAFIWGSLLECTRGPHLLVLEINAVILNFLYEKFLGLFKKWWGASLNCF